MGGNQMKTRIVITFIIWTLSSTAINADWVEARSENFTFVGKTSERKAATIVRELEEYRAIIFKILNLDPIPEMVPVKIYGVKSSKAITKMTGRVNAAGVYLTTFGGPVFVLDISGNFSKNSAARKIAYHEYTHHLVDTYTNTVYPTWFNEGFAEYLSTFKVDKKGVVKVGLPDKDRAYSLASYGWMDMEAFLGAIRGYPFENKKTRKIAVTQSQFYAQSWLAVHYIYSTEEYAEKLDAYLEAIAQESMSKTAFNDAFGVTPKEFGGILGKYFKQNQYLYRSIKLATSDRNHAVETRKLTKSEAYFHRGEATRHFRNGKTAQKLIDEYYNKSVKAGDAPLAEIEASRAFIAIENGDEETALKNIDLALKKQPNNSRILRIAGHIYLDLYVNQNTASDLSQIKRARSFLKKSMRANPRNITAHFDYVSTYAVTNDKISRQAIHSALECASYYKGRNFIDSNLRIAEVFVRENKFEDAQPLLEKAIIWSISPEARSYAQELLERTS